MRLAAIAVFLIMLWPLSADELMTLSASLRQRIENADRLLMQAQLDYQSAKEQRAIQKKLNEESGSVLIERENAWQQREEQYKQEIARQKAEKAELLRQEENYRRDAEISTALIGSLRSERTIADRALRRQKWKTRLVAIGEALVFAAILVIAL